MIRAVQITRRPIKNRKTATRRVPEVVREWAEEFGATVDAVLESQNADWGVDIIQPSGEPHWVRGGYVRRADSEIERLEIVLSSSIYVDFNTEDQIQEAAFNLRSLADELARFADCLVNPELTEDDDE